MVEMLLILVVALNAKAYVVRKKIKVLKNES